MFLFYSAEQPLCIKEHVLTQSYPQGHVSCHFGKYKFTYSYLFFSIHKSDLSEDFTCYSTA